MPLRLIFMGTPDFAVQPLLALAGWVLRAPVEQLAGLYGSTFHLLPPTAAEMAVVLGLTTLSGWLGAWLTVTRTLRQVMAAR